MLADRLVGVAGYHRPQVAAIRVVVVDETDFLR